MSMKEGEMCEFEMDFSKISFQFAYFSLVYIIFYVTLLL